MRAGNASRRNRSHFATVVALLALVIFGCGGGDGSGAGSGGTSGAAGMTGGTHTADMSPDAVAAAYQNRFDLNLQVAKRECMCDPDQTSICDWAANPPTPSPCMIASIKRHASDVAALIECDIEQAKKVLACLEPGPCTPRQEWTCAAATTMCSFDASIPAELMADCPNG